MSKEFGKRFWGTGGKWIQEKDLLGFAEYSGHAFEWEDSAEALEESETKHNIEPDTTAVMVGAVQLRGGSVTKASDDEDGDMDGGGDMIGNEDWGTDEDG